MYNPAMSLGVESQRQERLVSEPERLGLAVLERAVFLLDRDRSLVGERSQDRRSVEYAVDTPKRLCGWDFDPWWPSHYGKKPPTRLMLSEERNAGKILTRMSLAVPYSKFEGVMHTLTYSGAPMPVLTRRLGEFSILLEKRSEEDDPSFPFRWEATAGDLREFLWLLGRALEGKG